jgi:hypothetical protein
MINIEFLRIWEACVVYFQNTVLTKHHISFRIPELHAEKTAQTYKI